MGTLDRNTSGRFVKGNKGGKGGKRKGAGRPPSPDPTLLKQLYALLEKCAPLALEKLREQLTHKDPKIVQSAAKAILSKVLPERSAHESWKVEADQTAAEVDKLGDFLRFQMEQSLHPDDEKSDNRETKYLLKSPL